MIQLIDNKAGIWHLNINEVYCTFIPPRLFIKGLLPHPGNADNGLRWRVNRKWVSYKQIKKEIRNADNR